MTGKSHIEDQAAGTYGSSEAAAGWQRSGAVRAQLLVPLTERMLDLAGGSGLAVSDFICHFGYHVVEATNGEEAQVIFGVGEPMFSDIDLGRAKTASRWPPGSGRTVRASASCWRPGLQGRPQATSVMSLSWQSHTPLRRWRTASIACSPPSIATVARSG